MSAIRTVSGSGAGSGRATTARAATTPAAMLRASFNGEDRDMAISTGGGHAEPDFSQGFVNQCLLQKPVGLGKIACRESPVVPSTRDFAHTSNGRHAAAF